jgi:hypothetical protein
VLQSYETTHETTHAAARTWPAWRAIVLVTLNM